MGLRRLYRESLFPHVTRWCLAGKTLGVERRLALADVRGEVLEVGFGSGLNLPFYPATVARLVAVDSSRTALRLAAAQISRAPFPVDVQIYSGEALPFPPESFDAVVFTWTLCMIDDPHAALIEAWRVLRPSGRLIFLEHGRSREPQLARWQDRWNALNRWLFAGCNINRAIDTLVRSAGFELKSIERYERHGPRVSSCVYRGVGVKTTTADAVEGVRDGKDPLRYGF
jgi:SAM-dependent methyltransferase